MNEPSCVLFLDFDGVTHPEPCSAQSAFCCLPQIEEVLLDFPAVEIVISSSWKEVHSLDELKSFFSTAMAPRVIDVTPDLWRPTLSWLPGPLPEFEREWEIQAWMKAQRPWGTRWLAIDDRPLWFRPGCPDLLAIDPNTGFLDHDQPVLRAMLKERT